MSCMHTAFVLQEAIRHVRDQRQKAFLAFLDVKKVFDTVWHNGLILKLLQLGLPTSGSSSITGIGDAPLLLAHTHHDHATEG